MPLDQQRLHQVVRETFGKLPHPEAPELTNAEYPVYQRVAAMMRNPHQPTAADVKDAYHQLQAVDLSPHEWEHAWTISRPIANRLLGQDPTLQELLRHRDAHPSEIYDYYWHHPSTSHPEIKAGEMARYGHMAADAASRHMDRSPLLSEVAQFASAGHHSEHIEAHYQRLAQDRNRGD